MSMLGYDLRASRAFARLNADEETASLGSVATRAASSASNTPSMLPERGPVRSAVNLEEHPEPAGRGWTHINILCSVALLTLFAVVLLTAGSSPTSLAATPGMLQKLFAKTPQQLIYLLPFTLPSDKPSNATSVAEADHPVLTYVSHRFGEVEEDASRLARQYALEAAEEAKRLAIEKAREAKRLAEEKAKKAREAKRREEEAKRRAEEKAKKKAEEAKRRAAEKEAEEEKKKLVEEQEEEGHSLSLVDRIADLRKKWAKQEAAKEEAAQHKLRFKQATKNAPNATNGTNGTGPAVTMFCFGLVIPWSKEPELIATQSDLGAGIFACDKAAIYSNQVMVIGRAGVKTKVLPNVDLHCKMGGKYWTALNTNIFKALWRKVLDDQEWVPYDWTLKLDPDTVLIPQKFRQLVSQSSAIRAKDAPTGTFLVNCRFGLHGPLEAVSRQGMWVYHDGWAFCPPKPPQEDVYLSTCLTGLNVTPVKAFDVLGEMACRTPNYQECAGNYVAYHPFKSAEAWVKCHRTAATHSFDAEG